MAALDWVIVAFLVLAVVGFFVGMYFGAREPIQRLPDDLIKEITDRVNQKLKG